MHIAALLESSLVLENYDRWTALWHRQVPVSAPESSLGSVIEQLHHANFELWHTEDAARDPHATDSAIAAAKRSIDRANQCRNDLVEQADTILLAALSGENLPNPAAELHSETPGLILDRLSILSLKRYHTVEEIERANAPAGHCERNMERLKVIEAQRSDLAACLDRLWRQTLRGERRFQLYRQLKMYNDPTLNPVLYGKNKRPAE